MLSTATREGMKEQVVDNLPKRIKQVKFGIMYVDPAFFTNGRKEEHMIGKGTIKRMDELISVSKVSK